MIKLTHLIADSILEVFEGNNWTDVSIAQTLSDITFDDAKKLTGASANTIASIVHHLQYWNGIVIQRMNGILPEIPAINGFDVNEITDENEWHQLIEETHQSFKTLANAVKHFPEQRLSEYTPEGKSTYYKNMQGIAEHAHYHLGQIIILKHIVQKKN